MEERRTLDAQTFAGEIVQGSEAEKEDLGMQISEGTEDDGAQHQGDTDRA